MCFKVINNVYLKVKISEFKWNKQAIKKSPQLCFNSKKPLYTDIDYDHINSW
jgi:hypothetical protein